MKIAIRGHESRGKEVIQILRDLGGINMWNYTGSNSDCHYELHGNTIICACTKSNNYKYYTLEEFEKEFPFKVGDLCIYYSGFLNTEIDVKILGMAIKNDCIMYEVGNKDTNQAHSDIYKRRHTLKPYKEMKKERNITLTLDKAKEWYNKGGELKEVALQAYSEEELTKVELPKTWEEFCKRHPVKIGEACINDDSEIDIILNTEPRDRTYYKNICPSQKSAEAHLAMIQLEQLRDYWRQGWKPTWDLSEKWCICLCGNELSISISTIMPRFLTFPTKEMAKEFLKCFRDLIEKARDLI